MKLSDTAIRAAKPREKEYKLSDGRGLFLLVRANGAKLWRYKYRTPAGKQNYFALGAYPEVTLAAARDRLLAARRIVAEGKDPVAERRLERQANAERHQNTFKHIADEWLREHSKAWVETHTETVRARLDNHVIPFIGNRPVREIRTPDVREVLDRLVKANVGEAARRVRQIVSQVFRFAISTGRADLDPAEPLRGSFAKRKVQHMAAVTAPDEFGRLLRAIDGYDGSIVTLCALRLSALFFVRPGELRRAEWKEINWLRKQWEIPAERTKMRKPLIVPLSTQALATLRELLPVTGHGKYVFPSTRTGERPMSENTINAALRRMGIEKDEHTAHGFRAAARTILDEVLHEPLAALELQLGHAVRDANGEAYNRTAHLETRTAMMQRWADYLDTLKAAKAENAERA